MAIIKDIDNKSNNQIIIQDLDGETCLINDEKLPELQQKLKEVCRLHFFTASIKSLMNSEIERHSERARRLRFRLKLSSFDLSCEPVVMPRGDRPKLEKVRSVCRIADDAILEQARVVMAPESNDRG